MTVVALLANFITFLFADFRLLCAAAMRIQIDRT